MCYDTSSLIIRWFAQGLCRRLTQNSCRSSKLAWDSGTFPCHCILRKEKNKHGHSNIINFLWNPLIFSGLWSGKGDKVKTAARKSHRKANPWQICTYCRDTNTATHKNILKFSVWILPSCISPPFLQNNFFFPWLLSVWVLRKGACGCLRNVTFRQIHKAYRGDAASTPCVFACVCVQTHASVCVFAHAYACV